MVNKRILLFLSFVCSTFLIKTTDIVLEDRLLLVHLKATLYEMSYNNKGFLNQISDTDYCADYQEFEKHLQSIEIYLCDNCLEFQNIFKDNTYHWFREITSGKTFTQVFRELYMKFGCHKIVIDSLSKKRIYEAFEALYNKECPEIEKGAPVLQIIFGIFLMTKTMDGFSDILLNKLIHEKIKELEATLLIQE